MVTSSAPGVRHKGLGLTEVGRRDYNHMFSTEKNQTNRQTEKETLRTENAEYWSSKPLKNVLHSFLFPQRASEDPGVTTGCHLTTLPVL